MYPKDDEEVKEIQEWAQTQNFLPRDLNKAFIATFLLGADGDKEKAKKVLCNYFYARQSIPEIFMGRDPLLKENVQGWKSSCFVPLPDKQRGCRVFLGASLNSENYSFVTFVKLAFMCYDLLIKNNEWGKGTRILVLSYDKMTYENLSTFTIYITRKTAELERENFLPGKLVGVHHVHIPPFMKKIHERFKPHLMEEDEKRIMFHKNLKSLHKYVSPDILPMEFGGRAGPLKNLIDKWWEILKAHRNFFVQEEEKRMKEARVKVGFHELSSLQKRLKCQKENYDCELEIENYSVNFAKFNDCLNFC